jgi:hypothetical protein
MKTSSPMSSSNADRLLVLCGGEVRAHFRDDLGALRALSFDESFDRATDERLERYYTESLSRRSCFPRWCTGRLHSGDA